MNTKEAAERLGVTDARVRSLIASGELIAEKFPADQQYRGVWLVERASVEALIEKRRQQRKERGRGRPPSVAE